MARNNPDPSSYRTGDGGHEWGSAFAGQTTECWSGSASPAHWRTRQLEAGGACSPRRMQSFDSGRRPTGLCCGF